MLPLLTREQMQSLDARTIQELGLPARVLMETAGKGCADVILQNRAECAQGRICVLCGGGNNGGDGAVAARWLAQEGLEVVILQIGNGRLTPDCKANLELCARLDIPILRISGPEELPLLDELVSGSSLVVDAIFGIGFKGVPEEWMIELFSLVNSSAACIVALDIPSGLDADTGYCVEAIYADMTVCIDHLKLGHVIGLGSEVCGELELVPIGIPGQYASQLDCAKLFTDRDFFPPVRFPTWHKNDYGKVYVFGGISGFTGAACLTARAALRAGAGYAYVLHRPELAQVYAVKLTEALTVAIPANAKGMPDARALPGLLADAGAVVIGPGLGRDAYALKLLETVLRHVKAPLVVDADALNLIAEHPELPKLLAKPNILITPHWGEFARLAGIGKASLEADCLSPLREFAAKHQARVLLKSHFSVYCDADQTLVNASGNDGLSTGGSGDVLAGIIASFLAQGLDIPDAAINASYLLGATAERLAEGRETPSILPSDIIDNLFRTEA